MHPWYRRRRLPFHALQPKQRRASCKAAWHMMYVWAKQRIQGGGSTVRPINAESGFPFTAGLHGILPVHTENVGMSICINNWRAKDWITIHFGLNIVINLLIKAYLPNWPIRQVHEIATSKALEARFLWSHDWWLKLLDIIGGMKRREVLVLELSIRVLKLTHLGLHSIQLSSSLPPRQHSKHVLQLIKMKMNGAIFITEFGLAFRSNEYFNSGWRGG